MPGIKDYLALNRDLNAAESNEVAEQLTAEKRAEFAKGWFNRDEDQPVKVVPVTVKDGKEGPPPSYVEGYFCQLKAILGKTPREIEAVLGIYGKLADGACVMRIDNLLLPGFYNNRAYTHLPKGKPYPPTGNKETDPYAPGEGVGQWRLNRAVEASVLAILKPGERFSLRPVNYGRPGE